MTRPLPEAKNVSQACRRVIDQKVGKPAIRLTSETRDCTASDEEIARTFSNFIMNKATLEVVEKEIRDFPELVTIEDYVCRYGLEWGFERRVIDEACARVQYLNQIVGERRFGTDQQFPTRRRLR